MPRREITKVLENGFGQEIGEVQKRGRLMEWQNQQQNQAEQLPMQLQIDQLPNPDGLYVKVMTDEQMELLRRQISVYATICEQLVEMHKAMTAQQDITGMRLGNLYCDPMMASSGHKITARQRWTPTPVQLQMLERIFDEGNGTPSKQKIREITVELSQHGQISEANVYNWFQNRRARSKRKQSVSIHNNADSEVETEVESPKEEKTKPVGARSFENLVQRTGDIYNHKPELNAEMQYLDAQSNKGEPVFHFRSCNSGHMSAVPSQRTDLTINKLEIPGYSSYNPCDGYDLIE